MGNTEMLKVTIEGRQGSGKTRLGVAIEQMLIEDGHTVERVLEGELIDLPADANALDVLIIEKQT